MKTEAARNLVRIVANYSRLGTGLILGLIFVPFTLGWVGNDAFGVIALIGAGTGLAGMFREIATRASVRELAAALHSGDRDRFRVVYNSALVVAAIAACSAVVIFAGVYAAIPLLKIPGELHGAARVLLVSQAVFLSVTTFLTPMYNMLVVQERFVRVNIWSLIDRAAMLIVALVVAWVFKVRDPALGVKWWGIGVAGMQLVTFLIPVAQLLGEDRRFVPHLGSASRAQVREVFSTMKWYVLVEVSSVFHERVAQIVANLFFGTVGNVVFSVALQFVSYVRVATFGVTFGLDAVAARLVTAEGLDGVRRLTRHSTRAQSLIAVPMGLAILVLAEPLMKVWLVNRIENPEHLLPPIVLWVRIMAAAVIVRAVSEGWSMILYGAGFVRRYAGLVLTAGVLNPLLTVVLLWVLPGVLKLTPPAQDPNPEGSPLLMVSPWVFAVLYAVAHGVLLPRIGARCLEMRWRDYYAPIAAPCLVALIGAPALFLPRILAGWGVGSTLLQLIVTAAVYGLIVAAAALALVLTPGERERFVWSRVRQVTGRVPLKP